MPQIGQRSFEWLLQDSNTAGAGDAEVPAPAGKFNVKCWAAAGDADWDGASIYIQNKAEDDTWITLYTFTADDTQFGELGVDYEKIRAFIVSPGTALLSATISYA
jgi:hypothetical protein